MDRIAQSKAWRLNSSPASMSPRSRRLLAAAKFESVCSIGSCDSATSEVVRGRIASASSTLPTHASILTGLYMFNHRQVANETPLDASLPNLARIARDAGHDPTLFGYTDTPLGPQGSGAANWVCPDCGARKEDFEMVEI